MLSLSLSLSAMASCARLMRNNMKRPGTLPGQKGIYSMAIRSSSNKNQASSEQVDVDNYKDSEKRQKQRNTRPITTAKNPCDNCIHSCKQVLGIVIVCQKHITLKQVLKNKARQSAEITETRNQLCELVS